MTSSPGADPRTHPDPEVADLVAEIVTGVAGVAGLNSGPFGSVATYLPGRRIPGIRLGPEGCAVHITAEYPADLSALADTVRALVEAVVGPPVHVTIEDVHLEQKQVSP
ncbi:hypothetical protein [Rhodococcus sp. NPDC060084]|uniref:hypothetical protein n=1 Tax=Rhodococcus sp. NPDC060084 TaxID=3347053 RepID=UPI00366088F3